MSETLTPGPDDRLARASKNLDRRTQDLFDALKIEAMDKLTLERARKDRTLVVANTIADLARKYRASEAASNEARIAVLDAHIEMIAALSEVEL